MRAFLAGILSSEESSGGGGGTTFNVNSANLNGVNQYFDAGNPSEFSVFSGTNSYSVEYWYKPETVSGATATVSKLKGTDREFNFGRSSSFVYFNRTDAVGFDTIQSTTPLTTNQWYHVVGTFDGTNMNLYINAGTPNTRVSTKNISPSVTPVILGGNGNTSGGIVDGEDCELSLPKIYNRALNASEITELYNDGTPRCFDELPTSITDDCVYAPRLGNWDTNAGQELIDQSASAITTTNVGSTPFDGTGLQVEC